MEIMVNGQSREVAAGTSIALLLEKMDCDPRTLAVEKNLQLVPRGEHAATTLVEGDCLEIVTLVGGG